MIPACVSDSGHSNLDTSAIVQHMFVRRTGQTESVFSHESSVTVATSGILTVCVNLIIHSALRRIRCSNHAYNVQTQQKRPFLQIIHVLYMTLNSKC